MRLDTFIRSVLEAGMEDAVQAAVEPVATYVALKRQIGELEDRADEARAAVAEILRGEPGRVWEFPGLATVTVVKGRESEKLDRAKLARAGIAVEVLDAATVRTVGQPSLRIVGDGE